MYLNREEEKMLDGEYGEATARAMEILVALGDIYGAERMVEISSAHLSGISYKTIGEGGLSFLCDFLSMGAKFRVRTTINPCGIDLERWKELEICDEGFYERQKEIVEIYLRMGAIPSLTCTPYYGTNLPARGDHIAWAESSAVIYVNSVIGAMTNREGAPSALAAAIIGRTPMYGMHLKENRKGREKVIVEVDMESLADYGALGMCLAEKGVKLPYIIFLGKKRSLDVGLKHLGAALASSGDIAMFHVQGITPEAEEIDHDFEERIEIDRKEIEEIFDKNTPDEDPELFAFGCPHLSKEELLKFLSLRPKEETWLSIGRDTYEREKELISELIKRGYRIIVGTCFVVSPIERRFRVTATNSGKATKYLRTLCRQKVLFRREEDLLG